MPEREGQPGAHSSVSQPSPCALFSRHGPSKQAVLISPSWLQPANVTNESLTNELKEENSPRMADKRVI